MTTLELQREALSRAVQGQSVANYAPIFQGFMAKGIPETEIKPRENVFTFNAWKALGRVVRRGEHGVKVTTVRQVTKTDKETGKEESYSLPWTTTVFHISQTDSISKNSENSKHSTNSIASLEVRQ
jgi:antirestriction factor ArdC-like protein